MLKVLSDPNERLLWKIIRQIPTRMLYAELHLRKGVYPFRFGPRAEYELTPHPGFRNQLPLRGEGLVFDSNVFKEDCTCSLDTESN